MCVSERERERERDRRGEGIQREYVCTRILVCERERDRLIDR